jgi:hypothetical protein
MSALNIGFVSSIASFAKRFSRAERDAALREVDVPDQEGDLRDEVGDRFASLCDLALKRVLREAQCPLKTIRVESGYGYAEHHKDWLRLGCGIVVEEEELDEALSFLQQPANAGIFDARIEVATKEFIDGNFREGLFGELSCSFYLLEEPQNA